MIGGKFTVGGCLLKTSASFGLFFCVEGKLFQSFLLRADIVSENMSAAAGHSASKKLEYQRKVNYFRNFIEKFNIF